MTKKFGETWWGKQWLNALENVDYEDRLTKGATCARTGHVIDINIKGNKIVANVSDSGSTPLKITTIIVPPFFEEDIERLMTKIIEHPAIIPKLLNRELDPAILTITEELGLKLFPRQWTDFKMNCNCRDWALVCKHIAAVIYVLSREIDNNPFLIFELHNVNLTEELKKRGVFIPD
jgi:uncharacterized Zn finger protein